MRALIGLAIALVVLWLLGWLVLRIATGLIHLVLIVGLALLVLGFLRRPRST